MELLSLEGTYHDGKVELKEKPEGVTRARVRVTFLPTESPVEEEGRELLRQRFLSRLKRGVDFGTQPLPTREELYAERLKRF